MSVVCCEHIRIGFRCFQVLRFVRQVFLIDCDDDVIFPLVDGSLTSRLLDVVHGLIQVTYRLNPIIFDISF